MPIEAYMEGVVCTVYAALHKHSVHYIYAPSLASNVYKSEFLHESSSVHEAYKLWV